MITEKINAWVLASVAWTYAILSALFTYPATTTPTTTATTVIKKPFIIENVYKGLKRYR